MFSDLVGSTALSARIDPEDLREIISSYQKCVAQTVQRFGGFVAKYMGDGVLVYFGYPQAHEDDAERPVRAALGLVQAVGSLKSDAPLQTRVGIATGLVVVGDLIGSGAVQEQTVVGETPNLAARLQGIAEPNTVIIAKSTRKLNGNLFELQGLRFGICRLSSSSRTTAMRNQPLWSMRALIEFMDKMGITGAYPMTNLLQQAINCDDGDRAAKLIQDALGIESDDVVNYCFPKEWPTDREREVHRRVAEDRGVLSYLVMLRIAATALLCLLLLPGHSVRAAEPEEVMTVSCSGTAEANNTRRPVKKIGLIINILEHTVAVSGLSVVARIDKVDDVNIAFGAASTAPGDVGIMGGIDRNTGDAWYLTFTRGKDKKLKRGDMFDLVCKTAQ